MWTYFDNDYSLFLISLALLLAIVLFFLKGSNDPYGLFHLTLNRLPSDNPHEPPKTEWLNMGYWEAETFPEACEALALRTIIAANPIEQGRVLDVGHGTGESLILLLTSPSLPRPSQITGITSLPAHHERSLTRANKVQEASSGAAPIKLDLHAGDAVFRTDALHPLNPSNSKVEFDTIIALDCAYHFQTRRLFLEQSFQKLAPGGSIALADICFSVTSIQPSYTRFLTTLLRLMPTENKITIEEYEAQLREIGYTDVRVQDISQEVFPGFIRFLKSRKWGWWIFAWVLERYWKAGARFVIASGKKTA
ncbi:S-adenosyl-L-methionine-dependent methyltransferase [Crepidotus variabilis]|uniref:S-adenosyl-L-methionine-dependent methyltransferase n=1 Tax=Crepidotus variabilis TaxID=179855 RepID=A0A9P6ELJ3_9AGAR|nr:S-adenosyl-L-methionine-dependent methyltransferase [Crepidotus variabilis]